MEQDYYKLLGIERNANASEIKQAYRKLTKQYHPDLNPNDKAAEEKFKKINEAYEVLKDEDKRAAYDRYGSAAFNGGAAGPGGNGYAHHQQEGEFADIFDIFEQMMGGNRGRQQARPSEQRGANLQCSIQITMSVAYTGGEREVSYNTLVKCTDCNATGGKGGAKATEPCRACNGRGRTREQQGFFTVERGCHSCGGSGTVIVNPCSTCSGQGRVKKNKTLTIKIPAGISDQEHLRVSGEGEAGIRGAPSGDLYIIITVKSHELFTRRADDLHFQIPIKMVMAALGGHIEVPGIDGKVIKITIPPGTQHDSILRIKGKGMPALKSPTNFGDLLAHVKVEIPVKLSAKQKNILKEFEKISDDSSSPESSSFGGKIKNFWSDLTGG